MTAESPRKPSFDRLFSEFADDILKLSDAELCAELEADGLEFDVEAAKARDAIASAITQSGKNRLETAKSALSIRRRLTTDAPLRIDDKAAVLARFASNDTKLRNRLTLAARNGEGLTDDEMDSILQDLRDLGAIDDEGNPV